MDRSRHLDGNNSESKGVGKNALNDKVLDSCP